MGAQAQWAGSLAIGIGEKANTTKQLKTNNFIMATDDSLQMEVARQAVNVIPLRNEDGTEVFGLEYTADFFLNDKVKVYEIGLFSERNVEIGKGSWFLGSFDEEEQTQYFSLAKLGNHFQSSGTATVTI